MLQEYYNTKDNLQIEYLISICDVKTSSESKYYDKSRNYFLNSLSSIDKMNRLFIEIFTEESFREAVEFIDGTK